MRVAVLDLGSNSFRLLVADVDPDGSILPILREREMLHLGGVVAIHDAVTGETLEQAAHAAHHLSRLAERTGADRRIVVATAAVREASNQREVVARLATACEEPIRVLTGAEEAERAFQGVAASVSMPPGAHLVLDLGGGSLELAVGQDAEAEWCASVDLGVSRLWAEVGQAEPLTSPVVDTLRTRVRRTLEPLVDQIAAYEPSAVVSVGGVNRSLAQLVAPERLRWQPETLNQFQVTRAEFQELTDLLLETTPRGRLSLPGMKRSRAAYLPAAGVIVSQILETLGVDSTYMSYWGLREGVILEEFGFTAIPTGHALRPASIDRMERRFSPHIVHDAHVADLAEQIFEQLTSIHRLGPNDVELLRYAAQLHTIGMGVAFRSYHRHGSYLVEHSEFRGFDPIEIAMLASLVRHHRRGFARSSYAPYESLSAHDRLRVDRLVAQLHLADALDRSLDQSIDRIVLEQRESSLDVTLEGPHVALRTDWGDRAREAFRTAFDLDLRFPEGVFVDAG